VERLNVVLLGVMLLLCGLVGGLDSAVGALLGGLLGIANLRAVRYIVSRLPQASERSKRALLLLFVAKFVGFVTAVGLVMFLFKPEPVPLMLGVSTVLVALVVQSVRFHLDGGAEAPR